MADNIFKFFPTRAQSRIPSQFFGEIDFGLRHSLDLVPKLNPHSEPFAPLIASDYDRLVIQKNYVKLQAMFRDKQDTSFCSKPRLEAVPNIGNNFCGVCHVRFDDYTGHIHARNHQEQLMRAEGFASVHALAAELHEDFMLFLVKKGAERREDLPTSSQFSEQAADFAASVEPLGLSEAPPLIHKAAAIDAACQTSASSEPATEKKKLRILCAKSRFDKWCTIGKKSAHLDWSSINTEASKTSELCRLVCRELSVLSRQAFRPPPSRLNFSALDTLLNQ